MAKFHTNQNVILSSTALNKSQVKFTKVDIDNENVLQIVESHQITGVVSQMSRIPDMES